MRCAFSALIVSGFSVMQSQPVAGREIVARVQRLQRDLVDLVLLHPHFFLVAVAIAHALDRFIQVVGAAIWIDIEHLDGEVGVLRVG